MLILRSVGGSDMQPAEQSAFSMFAEVYSRSSPTLQAAMLEHAASSGGGGDAFLRQQVIAGGLGVIVGVVAARFIFGGR
jgi:hypothetical protein